LIEALKARDLPRLESLTSLPGLLNASDSNKHTPLHVACLLGFEREAKCLLKSKADLEARDFQRRTPLGLAALAGNSALVLLLIQAGANKSAVDGWEATPLHLACRAGSLMSVDALLAATPKKQLITYVDRVKTGSITALMEACEAGEVAICQKLLESGANPNIIVRETVSFPNTTSQETVTWPGTYCLPSTAAGLQILNLLASFGADFFCGDADGRNHLHVNALKGRADICRELISISINGPKAEKDGVPGSAPSVTLVTSKLDINAKTKKGRTALWLATSWGHTDTSLCLLESGADATIECRGLPPGVHDELWFSPLGLASYLGHGAIVSYLIAAGVRVDQVSAGVTPLCTAAGRGHLGTCQILIDADANVNFMRKYQWSVLSIAANEGKVDVVELLLKKGATAWPSAFLRKSNQKLSFKSGVPDESRRNINLLLRMYLGGSF
jgi:ankyrin repeat protein